MLRAAALSALSAVLVAAPALAAPPEAIELILDASGSMNAGLDGKQTRLEAARAAVRGFLGALPAGTSIAFRAYGHQSPREKHDCADTALIVPFTPAAEAKAKVGGLLDTIKAQGYTPITKVIELAARDFSGPPASPRMIILVSDGKETCAGDPCAMARALKEAQVNLVIHTVGLGVDQAAETELTCVATVTGGSYFAAADAGKLEIALRDAAVTPPKIVKEEKAAGGGVLAVEPPSTYGHTIVDAVTGKQLTTVNIMNRSARVPAGTYNVTFGPVSWKGVVVKAGQTTTLRPAVLEVATIVSGSVTVIDPETSETVASLNKMNRKVSLLPGVYHVRFGKAAAYPYVRLDSGAPVLLKPGILKVTGKFSRASVKTPAGEDVVTLDPVNTSYALPPGRYVVVPSDSTPREVEVREGETTEVAVARAG